MKIRLVALWDAIRTSLWFVPTIMTMAAIALSFLVVFIDRHIEQSYVEELGWFYAGGPEGARQMLSTIAGSMITVAGVAFSITIVALALASQQFGPRMLRNFMRDLGNQIVLGTFISTFIYCLLVLRTIRGLEDHVFVPHVSVTIGVALALASFGVLIYFIHHVSSSIQAATLVKGVADDLIDAVDRLYPERMDDGNPDREIHSGDAPEAPSGVAVGASAHGYVQAIDSDALLELAASSDLRIRLVVRPGNFVTEGMPLAIVNGPKEEKDDVAEQIRATVIMGIQRTSTQDAEFVVNQLVEIAVRALSPGVNDPFTAINCIDQLSAALARLARRPLPERVRRDSEGVVRVIANGATFVDVLRTSFNQVRQHGRNDIAVTMRLLEAIAAIGAQANRRDDQQELRRQADMIMSGADPSVILPEDYQDITGRYEAAIAAIEAGRRLPETGRAIPTIGGNYGNPGKDHR